MKVLAGDKMGIMEKKKIFYVMILKGMIYMLSLILYGVYVDDGAVNILLKDCIRCTVILLGYIFSKHCSKKYVLICVGIVYIFLISQCNIVTQWIHIRFWKDLFVFVAPFIYVLIFQYLVKKYSNRQTMARVVYLGTCFLIYIFLNDIIYLRYEKMAWPVETCIYLIILSLMIYVKESKANPEKIGFRKNLIMVSVYIFSCITAMIVGNERLRNIIEGIGRGFRDIPVYHGTDWVGYRLAALKSFWTGDVSIIETFCGKSGTEGYIHYTLGGDFESILFQSNKVILILFICMVLVVSVLLFHIDLEKPKWNRVKSYLAVSYVIRTGIYVLMISFMFYSPPVKMPFIMGGLMEIVILYLWMKRKYETGQITMENVNRD